MLRQHFFEESLVGKNPTYPVDQISPRKVRANVSTRILSGASFRGTQVGGRTAATGLGTALVFASHVNASHTCILIRFMLNLGERGGSVSSELYN